MPWHFLEGFSLLKFCKPWLIQHETKKASIEKPLKDTAPGLHIRAGLGHFLENRENANYPHLRIPRSSVLCLDWPPMILNKPLTLYTSEIHWIKYRNLIDWKVNLGIIRMLHLGGIHSLIYSFIVSAFNHYIYLCCYLWFGSGMSPKDSWVKDLVPDLPHYWEVIGTLRGETCWWVLGGLKPFKWSCRSLVSYSLCLSHEEKAVFQLRLPSSCAA